TSVGIDMFTRQGKNTEKILRSRLKIEPASNIEFDNYFDDK
ncbi:117_t:CDS:1, partial [Racocetra persica]